MASIKKYNGSTFVDAAIRKYSTASEIITPPTTIYADGSNITTYTIKGNTVQNGTPTPSNPVEVNGVGDKTANILPRPTAAASGEINGVTYSIDEYGVCTFSGTATAGIEIIYDLKSDFTIPISVSAGGHGVVAFNNSISTSLIAYFMYNQTPIDNWNMIATNRTSSAYSSMGNKTINRIRFVAASGSNLDGLTVAIAFSDDDTAVSPFVPSGYKIPISNGQQTTNIYLGSTQTVRAVKKLVLTGEEYFVLQSINDYGIANFQHTIPVEESAMGGQVPSYSSHFVQSFSSIAQVTSPCFMWANSPSRDFFLRIEATTASTVAELKAWLAAQYAAGTPVTLWYVLATPETATVNEPLMKIGDYVDTLSNATSIPTTEGANSITVDTTVQPSEFTATWTGWHDATIKEWDGSDWG